MACSLDSSVRRTLSPPTVRTTVAVYTSICYMVGKPQQSSLVEIQAARVVAEDG